MSYRLFSITLFAAMLLTFAACSDNEGKLAVSSPSKELEVALFQNEEGEVFYEVLKKGEIVLEPSQLGLIRRDAQFEKNLLYKGSSEIMTINDNYTLAHGKRRNYSYTANQAIFTFINASGDSLQIEFRVSNDGVALRYIFPENTGDKKVIESELTRFNLPDTAKAWLQPLAGAKTGWARANPSYEEHYSQGIKVGEASPYKAGWAFPALFKVNENWVLISETGLDNSYCGCRLYSGTNNGVYRIGFPQEQEVIFSGGLLPESSLPWKTPWRIIAVGSLETLVESSLGTDLAQPAIDGNFDFVKPGRASWSWVILKDGQTIFETQKAFIDYAADMGWEYCLIDALWDVQIGYEKVKELVKYGKSKNVGILLWYNSAGDWNDTPQTPKDKLLNHEERIAEFKRLKEMGVAGVKIDFFGGDGRSVIQYYTEILEDAADVGILVNFHGCTLPRGWQRTYPNLMTMEAIKGLEFTTFGQPDADAVANHCAMIPFTRNVFDPMDFTPTVFSEIPGIERKTSNAFELALPVLFLSGVQHYGEIPSGMASVPSEVKALMQEIPVDWDESKFVAGFPGKEVVIARRKGNVWYVAGINGEQDAKTLQFKMPFDQGFTGTLYADGENNREFAISSITKAENGEYQIDVLPNGGFVMKLVVE